MTVVKGKKTCPLCGAQPKEDHHPRCDEDRAQQKSLGIGSHYYYNRDASDAAYYGWEEVEEEDYSENSFP